MDVSWLHDIVPSKIKYDLNCCCQLMCDDWGIPNTKLTYCQCTSAALLCCKKHTIIWLYMTDNDTWMMNLNSPIYSTLLPNKFLIWGLLLCIWDFGRSRNQNRSGGSVYTGSLIPHLPVSSRVLGCEENLYFECWNSWPHHWFSQSGESRSHSWPITQCPITWTWESTPKQCSVMAIVKNKSPTFKTVLRGLNGCICIYKCAIRTHFEWVLLCWSSLCQLNLEPTQPDGLVGCKVPTDLVKISVK